jgi:hypothetical protein
VQFLVLVYSCESPYLRTRRFVLLDYNDDRTKIKNNPPIFIFNIASFAGKGEEFKVQNLRLDFEMKKWY